MVLQRAEFLIYTLRVLLVVACQEKKHRAGRHFFPIRSRLRDIYKPLK
jgi:hypothetical protein